MTGLRAGAHRLSNLAGVLDMALAQWDGRDDTRAQPERRRAASEAMAAIDDMTAALHQVRGELQAQMQAYDDDALARADELLRRREEEGR